MALRSKQLSRVANAVINSFLQRGILPSVRNVITGVYSALGGRLGGMPTMTFTPIATQSLTDVKSLTMLSTSIADDVQSLYDENIDQVNRIVRDFDYKQTHRERLAQRIVELTSELTHASTAQILQANGTIGSFEDIDFANTSAFVNFRDYTVELPPASNQTQRIDLRGATLDWSSSGSGSTIGQLSDIINDILNQAFFVAVTSADQTAQLTLSVSFPTPTVFSKISLTAHIGSTTAVTAIVDDTTLETRTLGVSRRANWEFGNRAVTTMKIILSKQHPDSTLGGNNVFDFGIKNLSLYLEEYLPSAIFTTQPIVFPIPIGTLTLTSAQEVPPNCGVQWALSTGGPFTPISTGTPMTFSRLTTVDSKRIYPVLSARDQARVFNVSSTGVNLGGTDQGLSVSAPIRGSRSPLFALARLNPSITRGNTVIKRGRNAWRVQSYHYNISTNGVVQDAPPSLLDFVNQRSTAPIYSRYQPVEFDVNNQYTGLDAGSNSALRLPAIEMPLLSQNDRTLHLFEAFLQVDPTLAPSVLAGLGSLSISVPNLFAGNRAALYCNGQKLAVVSSTTAGSLQYTVVLPLQPGSNRLQIVTNNYASLNGGSFDVGTATFLGLCAYGGQISWFADEGPLTEVALFELQYQTARNDFSRFARALDPITGGQLAVIRELPTCLYELTTLGMNALTPTTVTLQATLSGSSAVPSLTPKISSYTLTTEQTV